MAKGIERRINALERTARAHSLTAAGIIRTLQGSPRNADEFVIWHRSLSNEERSAWQAVADQELAEWRRRKESR